MSEFIKLENENWIRKDHIKCFKIVNAGNKHLYSEENHRAVAFIVEGVDDQKPLYSETFLDKSDAIKWLEDNNLI